MNNLYNFYMDSEKGKCELFSNININFWHKPMQTSQNILTDFPTKQETYNFR